MEHAAKKKINEFFVKYPKREYTAKKILIFNNEQPGYVYYLVSGNVKQYGISKQGNEVVLNIFKPPAFFPISHVVNEVPNRYIYETATEVEARVAPAVDVLDFLRSEPDVMFDLIKRLYSGLDGVLGRTMNLMLSGAKNRLIYELILESERSSEISETKSRKVLISKKELGERTGLSRETISREISKLKKDGLIESDRKEINIMDITSFKKAYYSDFE